MPDLNLGALTIPAFATIFGAGWGACYSILVRPLQARQDRVEARLNTIEDRAEARLNAIEAANQSELADLRKRAMGQ